MGLVDVKAKMIIPSSYVHGSVIAIVVIVDVVVVSIVVIVVPSVFLLYSDLSQ